jgi:ComF family protein
MGRCKVPAAQQLWNRSRRLSTETEATGLQLPGWTRNLLFPSRCRLCGAAPGINTDLCRACLDDLPWLESGCCRCARSLPAGVDALLCGACQKRTPVFDAATALLHYHAPADYLIQRLKFSGELAIAPLLAGLLAGKIARRSSALPDLLIPVPLHRARLRERGFNQATELARHLGRHLAVPVEHRLCRRNRHTHPQSLTPPRMRRRNLRGAFSLDGELATGHVAIIDDVMTTGHTADELAGILRRAGAVRVEVWIVARSGH